MKTTQIFILLFFLAIAVNLNAQQGQFDIYNPKIIPPSPNAASITKVGDVPVNLYSGSAQITVPIYTIQSGDISIPISLTSSTSGIRISEESGTVGLGWALNAGGVINRTIMDKDDFESGNYFNSVVPEIDSTPLIHPYYFGARTTSYVYDFFCDYNVHTARGLLNFREPLLSQSYDMEADVYSFSFLNYSGKFYIKRNRQIILNKQENLRIQCNPTGTAFTITDDKGYKFLFNDLEYTRNSTDATNRISAWYLSQIISPTNETVSFNYFRPGVYASGLPSVSQTDRLGCSIIMGSLTTIVSNGNDFSNLTLERIQFSNGKVEFYHDANRTDLLNATKIHKISIFNKPGPITYNELYSYQLHYSYFNENYSSGTAYENKRLRLDSVQQSSSGNVIPPYKFTYYHNPTDVGSTQKNSYNIDFWGYHNGAGNSLYLVPSFTGFLPTTQQYVSLTGANRRPSFEKAKQFTLQSISYPTGGRSVFDLEGNDYDYDGSRPYGVNLQEQTLINQSETKLIFLRGSSSGSINMTRKYGTSVTFSVAFRCQSAAAAQVLHSSGGNIYISIFGTTIDIASSSLTLQSDVVWVTGNLPITLPAHTIHPWSAFINSSVTGFNEITLRVEWQEIEANTNPTIEGGGLRIKSVTNYDASGAAVGKKIYEYNYFEDRNADGTPDRCSYGKRLAPLMYGRKEILHMNETQPPYNLVTCHSFTRFGTSLTATTSAAGYIVGYDQVSEYTVDSNDINKRLGKTVYQFYNGLDTMLDYQIFNVPGILNIAAEKNGLMKVKTEYQINGSQQYMKVTQLENFYSTVNRKIIYNLKTDNIERGVAKDNIYCPGSPMTEIEYIGFLNPVIQSSKILLDSNVMISYNSNDETKYLVTSTRNFYDNPRHYQLTRTKVLDSRGNIKTNHMKYPQDFYPSGTSTSTGNAVLDSLISKNMVSIVLESKDSLYSSTLSPSNKITGANTTFYKILPSTVIVPDKLFKLQFFDPLTSFQPLSINAGNLIQDSKYQQILKYDEYDNYSNILQYTTTDGVPVSFLWDYNFSYPVAEVKGATFNQIAYTSFEAGGTGNWSRAVGNKAPIVDMTAPTGHRVFEFERIINIDFTINDNGEILYANLDSNKTYIVSYWKKDGGGIFWTAGVRTYPQRAIIGKNGWTYYEVVITGEQYVTVQNVSWEKSIIDELRLYPLNAQMSTYTYNPLVGMTSQCDANNKIIYYEYDNFGRLKLIRDQDRKIIKVINYKYQEVSSY